jgi:hypothetical protein
VSDEDGALSLLAAAFEARDPELIWLDAEPRLDPLRGDRRFAGMAAAVANFSRSQ